MSCAFLGLGHSRSLPSLSMSGLRIGEADVAASTVLSLLLLLGARTMSGLSPTALSPFPIQPLAAEGS